MSKNWTRIKAGGELVVAGSMVAALIAGCGGGGGGSTGPGTTPTAAAQTTLISGTAATGAPITGKVVAVDATGKVFGATTAAQGAYTINVAGGTPPFILSVVGTSGGKLVTLNSVARGANQTANITPLTDLIVSTAAGQPGGAALASLCAPTVTPGCSTALANAASGTRIASAVAAVSQMVAPLNTTNVDPMNGQFAADGTGMDGVLDKILVSPASAPGATATVTLIAAPAQQLGTVTMPATAGGTATTTTVTPSAGNLALATVGATAMSEINTCLAALSAYYPANMTTPPTPAQVTPFVDPTFMMGGAGSTKNQAWFAGVLTTPAAQGGFAAPGFAITALGLAAFDLTPQATTALAQSMVAASPITLNAGGTAAASAWVRLHASGNNGGDVTFKMIRTGVANGNCAAGWTLAGNPRIETDVTARVSKWMFNTTTYKRELPFHMNTADAIAQGASSVVFTGPGLAVYSGNPATPVGAASAVAMVVPPVPAAPAVQQAWLGIQGQVNVVGSYYTGADAIQSCQDLAAISPQPANLVAGTPCYDEAAVAPGAVYVGTVSQNGTVLYAYSMQLNAVPLSNTFLMANDKDLFPQGVTATPATVAGINTAAAAIAVGAPIDNIISFSYTMSSVYGGGVDSCNVGLLDSTAAQVLYAEVKAGQSSCVFNTPNLYSGSLKKPATAFVGTAANGMTSYKGAGATVLGNRAGVLMQYL